MAIGLGFCRPFFTVERIVRHQPIVWSFKPCARAQCNNLLADSGSPRRYSVPALLEVSDTPCIEIASHPKPTSKTRPEIQRWAGKVSEHDAPAWKYLSREWTYGVSPPGSTRSPHCLDDIFYDFAPIPGLFEEEECDIRGRIGHVFEISCSKVFHRPWQRVMDHGVRGIHHAIPAVNEGKESVTFASAV